MTSSTTTELAAVFLADTAEPVREQLSASTDLRNFLDGAGSLTLAERTVLVEQALVLFEQNYVHLPLKVAMHAVNPVQRLRLLRNRLQRQAEDEMEPEWMFHAEMSEVFHSVRDLHTNYLLPQPFAGKIAYLPFQIEEYFEGEDPHYLVSRLVPGYAPAGFDHGAEITHWNGVPIARAIELNAARFAGSNAAARHARGVDTLTIRSLQMQLPPNEEWITVSYVGTDGVERELREKWLIVDNLPQFVEAAELSETAVSLGLDLDTDETTRAKKLLFAPQVVEQEAREVNELTTTPAAAGEDVPTDMPGVFRARSVTTASGTFGHIRIFTFTVDDPFKFVREFVRLLRLLPQDGLILDVRGNGGGHIYASEFTLQTLTPRRIAPEPVQFISTPLNLRICKKHRDNPTNRIDLGPWYPSLEQATETGATFSNAIPMTPVEQANEIGQVYLGPVVLITDARCYSATDIFAAGFQDHDIGPILGVQANTGAGGANVWMHGLLKSLLEMPETDSESPYQGLPNGADMRVSIRRMLRVGPRSGTPLEDLGVVPDVRHYMTKKDLLEGNTDLLERAGELLAGLPVRRLAVEAVPSNGDLAVVVDAASVDRADIYLDGRPRASIDLGGGTAQTTLPGLQGGVRLRVEGFAAGELVCVRTVDL